MTFLLPPCLLCCLILVLAGCGGDAAKERPVTLDKQDLGQTSSPVDMAQTPGDLGSPDLGARDMRGEASDLGTHASQCTDRQQNGQETGVDCGGACPTLCPPCASVGTRLFVTKSAYLGHLIQAAQDEGSGALSGVEAADYLCTQSAETAGLGGSWRAWVSGTQGDARDRVKEGGPWYFVNRCELVVDSIATLLERGPNTRLDRDETGALIPSPAYWTGTKEDGTLKVPNCTDWGARGQTRQGVIAELGATGTQTKRSWTDERQAPCKQVFSLLCLEQN